MSLSSGVRKVPLAGGPLPVPRPAGAILFAVAAVLYLPTLGNGLTNWDDPRYVAGNPFASRGLSGIPAAWTSPHDDAYYPLTHTLYCLIQEFAGPSPLAHHLVQVAIFALAVALVPAALAAFRVPRGVAFWAALLWAVHPLRVESVSWAANLKDTLSVALVLGAFVLRGEGRRWPSAALFALALLAKSTVFPVAGLFALLSWREGRTLRDALREAGPWLVPAAAVAAVAASLHLGGDGRDVPGGSPWAAIPSVLWLPWWYAGRVLWPLPSLAIHPFRPVEWVDPRLALALGLWAALAAFVLRGRSATRRDRVVAVGAWWLPGAAVTGLVPLAFPVADRYTLLPSLAIAAGIAFLAERALDRWPRGRRAVPGVLVAAAAALGASSLGRQEEWKDSIAFWEADRDRDGTVVAARVNLIGAYGAERRWDDVLREVEALVRMAPDRPTNTADLFLAHASKGGMETALATELFATLRTRTDPGTLREVAVASLRGGQFPAPRVEAEAAVRAEETAAARGLAAQAANGAGHHEEALAHAEKALALDPTFEDARVSRARALLGLNRFDEALAATEVEVASPGRRTLLLALRAAVLEALGREAQARELLERLRSEAPGQE